MRNQDELFKYLGFDCPPMGGQVLDVYYAELGRRLKQLYACLPPSEITGSMQRPTESVKIVTMQYYNDIYRPALNAWLADIATLVETRPQSTRVTIHNGVETLAHIMFTSTAVTVCQQLATEYVMVPFVKGYLDDQSPAT